MEHLEKHIQKSIIDYLSYRKDLYFIRSGSGLIKTEKGKYFKSGKPGCPDVIVCYKGRFIGLEIKTSKGKQSQIQKITESLIKECGGEYYIVKSLDDVLKILNID